MSHTILIVDDDPPMRAIIDIMLRREGYEVLVSRPEVLWKKGPNGEALEPIEKLFVEVPNENLGGVMENLSFRKAQITNMNHIGSVVSIEADPSLQRLPAPPNRERNWAHATADRLDLRYYVDIPGQRLIGVAKQALQTA